MVDPELCIASAIAATLTALLVVAATNGHAPVLVTGLLGMLVGAFTAYRIARSRA